MLSSIEMGVSGSQQVWRSTDSIESTCIDIHWFMACGKCGVDCSRKGSALYLMLLFFLHREPWQPWLCLRCWLKWLDPCYQGKRSLGLSFGIPAREFCGNRFSVLQLGTWWNLLETTFDGIRCEMEAAGLGEDKVCFEHFATIDDRREKIYGKKWEV